MTLESRDTKDQEAGNKRFQNFLWNLALGDVGDTAELHGRPFLLSIQGDLLPDPNNEQAMSNADHDEYRIADVLTRLSKLRGENWTFRKPDTDAMREGNRAELLRLVDLAVNDNTPTAVAA